MTETTRDPKSAGPLTGMRVIEIGHFIAAPFCTRVLGDLGADVIKIEPPGGDPIRQWGRTVNGAAPWWSMHGRNKRSVTLNLKHPKARDIVLGLARNADALVENFRPGQLAKMGLGDEALRTANPGLVVAHVSGYGQDGPYRDRAAFGVIGESIGGLRYLSNHPPEISDLPPVRVGVSIGDSIAGLYAAFGIMAALWQRDRAGGDERARTLDVALTESVLSMMEGVLPEYGAFGEIREPVGARIASAAPSSAYPTMDGGWILIAANSDPLFARLSALMGQPDLPSDPRFTGNRARVANVDALDALIGDWTRRYEAKEVDRILAEADIPATLVYTAAEIAADPQFRSRGMVREVEDPAIGRVLQAGIVPHVPDDPGQIRWAGPALGAHTDEVMGQMLGLGGAEIQALRDEGVL
jgi:crotonobetainyl-CoA:carnitine CoA-transferase CaiB-like acyl-CoA transferase